MSEITDSDQFLLDSFNAKVDTVALIYKWYGGRCEEYEETCRLCRIWKLYDELFKNPFERAKP